MKIGIDVRVLENKMTGIGRYLSDILKSVPLYDTKNKYTLFSTREINSLKKNDFDTIHFESINSGSKAIPNKLYSPYWLNFVLPALVEKNEIDIFFSPNNLLPIQKLKCKSAITVHDVFHLIDKKYHPFFYRNYLNFQLPFSIKNSDAIITISENSKNDLLRFFQIDPDKIKVIHRAADPKFIPLEISDEEINKLKKRFDLPQKFILFVGVMENRKNILGILKIADIVFKKRPDLKFLLVGKPGHGFNKIRVEINKRENVIYKNYIEDEYITAIYNLAFLFLFPSFYEGFGLPPLEAMQCGIPVVCSDIPVLKEVVGNNGILRDPENYAGFAEDILELATNHELYSEMKKRSVKQSKNFSFKESILKLLRVFEELQN